MTKINEKKIAKWVKSLGRDNALKLLSNETGLSLVTVEKIIHNRYQAKVSFLARQKIAQVVGCKETTLWEEHE